MSEAIHCFERATVRFAIYPDGHDGQRVLAEIHEHALRDVFQARGGPNGLLEAFDANAGLIEKIALERYEAASGSPILLDSEAFDIAQANRARTVGTSAGRPSP